jgi:hypothetical protein
MTEYRSRVLENSMKGRRLGLNERILEVRELSTDFYNTLYNRHRGKKKSTQQVSP